MEKNPVFGPGQAKGAVRDVKDKGFKGGTDFNNFVLQKQKKIIWLPIGVGIST